MLPFLRPEVFPKSILPQLANYIKNPKASSDTDLPLALALKAFDPPNKKTYVFQIQEGAKFIASNGKTFKKGKKRRSRYACMAIDSGRMYAFNPNAEVKLLED
ncbi:MAG: sprT domain-containing protein, partial [Bacteroidota bacterium]|nr:sprT domain-containing protein [Bacteroidota bacterium]